tara:strand:- start:214 stop:861 length:648 start_codon:yes stop_codon:yes gene_type:complete
MKESLTSYTRLQKLIKEALSVNEPKKKDCGCNSCKCKEKTNSTNPLHEGEIDQFELDLEGFSNQLSKEIKDELEDKEKELNEIVGVVGIIGYILLSNTVVHMLSKFSQRMFKKYNFGKGEEAAKKIEQFTHKNEEAFKTPIRRIVGLFTKNDKSKKLITDMIYAVVILLMAGQAGGNAVQYMKKTAWLKSGLYGLKSTIKGAEVHNIIKDVISGI